VRRTIRVMVASGPDKGLERLLDEGTVFVGTHEDCSLRLTDEKVSRRHCELAAVADGVRVVDLGSKNGVRHNGALLERAILAPGALVKLGATELRFDAIDDDVPPLEAERFGDLVTRAAPMRSVLGLLGAVAPTDASILLLGETGTGKDVLARAIHAQSKRGQRPFVVIDCGALSATLVQSELFGHKKGAFTGADADREGAFEAASHGTVFIDEIGELPLELQPALLRVLESRSVRRVGDNQPRAVDMRVIAATNKDLQAEVSAGRFRADLFYRLAVVQCRVPPLRERLPDVPVLVDAILADLRATARPSSADLAKLQAHEWPGNVRELRNTLEQALALGGGSSLRFPPMAGRTLDDSTDKLPPRARGGASGASGASGEKTLRTARGDFERDYLVQLLAECGGNVSEVARRAGVDRNHVHRLIKKYGIEKDG
jgi:DNA-binding NtrC family response regulator